MLYILYGLSAPIAVITFLFDLDEMKYQLEKRIQQYTTMNAVGRRILQQLRITGTIDNNNNN